MKRALALTGICVAVALGACGSDDEEPEASNQTRPQAGTGESNDSTADSGSKPAKSKDRERTSPAGLEVTTADSQFGEILFDGDRRAIYLFDKERDGVSECYGECAAAWPPVLTPGEPQGTGAVKGRLLGTTRREDGSTQVTYDGHPLYYYVDDPRGEVLCHNVFEFGGLWLVLQPSGDPAS